MQPRIVSRDDWLVERRAFLAEEKAFTHARDALSAKRRALPAVRIDRDYRFDTEHGPATLADLFDGRRQLLVYHFMFGADWEQGCPSCSFWVDNFDGVRVHLAARDTTLICVSKAPLDKLLAYRERMGWGITWASAGDSGFNEDFHVSFDPEAAEVEYNYATIESPGSEMPGLSAFLRGEDGSVLHSYSTYSRGIDMINGAYHLLDMTPLGRQEEGKPIMYWLKRHDRY